MDGERLFCDTALAERIERAEARLIAESSDAARMRRGDTIGFARPLAGGVASFAEADSPFNKIAGLGFDGLPDALDEVEAAFAELGAPVQVELCQLADPALGVFFTERGYRLESFENVLGRRVTGAGFPEDVRPIRDDELERWLSEVADAVAVADTEGLPSHEDFPRQTVIDAMADMAGVTRYAAWRGGEFAGGASFRVTDGIAQFTGAATVPAHRRRGVQTALLRARLTAAAAAGCDVAVVTTQPGSKSHQNVQRQGFDLLYARAILVKGTSATSSSGADSRQAS
ncbi:GNAT family acetyltransferase [Amycolatopsis sp. NBRC 101858]|uniref:GNAT family N-acetyltransferase n=1 Tax=Amycolatopsis sp. NBRC 101858 TaxID=3032200 RepID=UPI0024A53AD1|nr:GNAT family N-acetyltransferase [Amycolatopsis sp. NBRC 101858]GLY36791.1 GNAT family acetyltransferase [Amycolatopsis sp. NBRC 101858]